MLRNRLRGPSRPSRPPKLSMYALLPALRHRLPQAQPSPDLLHLDGIGRAALSRSRSAQEGGDFLAAVARHGEAKDQPLRCGQCVQRFLFRFSKKDRVLRVNRSG